jgi:transcriptional regulator with XRE-family HTH domain
MESKHEILNLLGENVRKYRRLLNISQEELAHRADLHRTYIGMIERAEKNITLVNIEKIANALEVNIEDLLKHSDNGNND